MFWSFVIPLFIISLIFPFIFSLLSIPAMGLVGVLGKLLEGKQNELGDVAKPPLYLYVLIYPIMGLAFLIEVYIISGWSAYVASRAVVYSQAPEVTHRWLYFVVGFLLCHGPLGFMAAKEGPKGSSSSCLFITIAMVVYVIFCIWPKMMVFPYGWFLDFIYG
jgi:hypothetical protein